MWKGKLLIHLEMHWKHLSVSIRSKLIILLQVSMRLCICWWCVIRWSNATKRCKASKLSMQKTWMCSTSLTTFHITFFAFIHPNIRYRIHKWMSFVKKCWHFTWAVCRFQNEFVTHQYRCQLSAAMMKARLVLEVADKQICWTKPGGIVALRLHSSKRDRCRS